MMVWSLMKLDHMFFLWWCGCWFGWRWLCFRFLEQVIVIWVVVMLSLLHVVLRRHGRWWHRSKVKVRCNIVYRWHMMFITKHMVMISKALDAMGVREIPSLMLQVFNVGV